MRSIAPALSICLLLILAGLIAATPALADTASGLPTGKRQHKPFTISKNWSGYRSDAQRLKDPKQRRAALQLIDALEAAKRSQTRSYNKHHRLQRGRKSRSAQGNQSDLGFLRDRARRTGKGGNDVAMEELTISHEYIRRVTVAYDGLRRTLGTRTDCVRKCDGAKRRCEARCRKGASCACVVDAADCLLSSIRAKRCSSAFRRGWPAKVTGPTPKSDDR